MEILETRHGRFAALVVRLEQCLLRCRTHEAFWAEVVLEWGLLGTRLIPPATQGKIRNSERNAWEEALRLRLAELKALPFLELMRKLAAKRAQKQKWLAILTEELENGMGRPALALFDEAGFAERAVFFERCLNPHEVPRRDKGEMRRSLEKVRVSIKATDLTPQYILHGLLNHEGKEAVFLAARRGLTWERILRDLFVETAMGPEAEEWLTRVPNLGEVYNPAVCTKVVSVAREAATPVLEEMTYSKFNQMHRAREMGRLVKKRAKTAPTMRETLVYLLERLPNARGCVERAMSLEGPLTSGQILSAILVEMERELPAGDVAETRKLFGMVEDQDGYVVSVVHPKNFPEFFKMVAPFFEENQVAELKQFVGPARAALEKMKSFCGKRELLDDMFQKVDPAEMVLPTPTTFVEFATAVTYLAEFSGKMDEFGGLTAAFSGSAAEYAAALNEILCPEYVARLWGGVLDAADIRL